MNKKTSVLAKSFERIRAHPLIVGILIGGSIVVGMSAFTNALRDLSTFFGVGQGSLVILDVKIIDKPSAIRLFRQNWLKGSVGEFPLLDIRLRNDTSTALFLTAMDFDVTQRVRKPNTDGCMKVSVSDWNYAVTLDAEAKRQSVRLGLSQSVPGHDVDRFVVEIGQHWSNSCQSGTAEYDMDLTLLYDRSRSVKLGRFPITIDGPPALEEVSAFTRERGGEVGVRRITSASTATR